MLIVFDLDDTLIETSKCLTPHALKRAFNAMQKQGLKAPESSLDELIKINRSSLTSKLALKLFCENYRAGQRIYSSGIETFLEPLPENISLETVPGALEIVEELGKNHQLALVTIGNSRVQLQKMKKAGIQPEHFSKLIVGCGPSKKTDYQQLLRSTGANPSDVIVCGDRVSIDLSPAKQLGLYTVHFRNGRGLICESLQEDVDKTITQLNELHEVFAKYEV